MTTATSISPALNRAADVLELIQKTTKNHNGAKAALKRSLTGDPRHLRAAYPFVLRFLSDSESKYYLNEWLFVSAVFAYYSFPELKREDKTTFGHSARRLVTKDSSGGPERRFRALLNTASEDLRSPLTAIVRLLEANNIAINYPQLLVDLCRWEHPDQFVQDKWARAFWNAPSRFIAEEEEEDTVTESE